LLRRIAIQRVCPRDISKSSTKYGYILVSHCSEHRKYTSVQERRRQQFEYMQEAPFTSPEHPFECSTNLCTGAQFWCGERGGVTWKTFDLARRGAHYPLLMFIASEIRRHTPHSADSIQHFYIYVVTPILRRGAPLAATSLSPND
jgi:hypothetical protein